MKLIKIIDVIEGKVLNPDVLCDFEIRGGCGADLMSDVLAAVRADAVLLTGLCNPQVVRTAEMADVRAIVIVRGKQPPRETVDLASQLSIPLVTSPFGMFEVCGRLYLAGLPSFENNLHDMIL